MKEQIKTIIRENFPGLYSELRRVLLPKIRKTTTNVPFRISNIELTNNCPFKCIMCVRTEGMTRGIGHMKFEVFKKAIDQYAESSYRNFEYSELSFTHFGESLTHPEFEKFIDYAISRGAKNTLLSINPLMLTEVVMKKLLSLKLKKIHFSLDGHDNETFERIRGVKNAYDKSKENLLKYVELNNQRKDFKTYVRLGMVNFSENAQSINEMEKFWKSVRGIDEVLIKPFEAWSGAVESVNKLVNYNPQTENNGKVVTCGYPWNSMTIVWDGKVVPCCADHNATYVLGDINKSSLIEIWNDTPMQNLRDQFLKNKVTNDLCKNCNYLYNDSPTF